MANQKKDKIASSSKNLNNFKWLPLVTGIIVLGWVAFTVVILLPPKYCIIPIPQDIGARGQLGDSFNIITSFVNSITLVFLIIGVFYTHAQYNKLLSDSADQIKSSNKDTFENSLFRMLSLHNDVVNSIQIVKEVDTGELLNIKTYYATTGRECFKDFYEHLSNYYVQSKKTVEFDRIVEAYDSLYIQDGHHTGQYFRRLFNIIRYIDKQPHDLFTQEEKYEYARIVRSQLSNFEIKLLLYNSLTPKGNDFADFIKRYKLLKGIAGEDLINPTHWDFAKQFLGEFWK